MAKGRKTGGRSKGTPNKATVEVETRCREILESPEYVKYFNHRLMVGQLPAPLETMVWAYAYGRPRERMEVTGLAGGPLVFKWQS